MSGQALISPLVGALNRDFTRVGRSRIAGKGLYAKRKIPRGSRIIEYLGAHVPLSTFLQEIAAGSATNTYAFCLREDMVIDGARGGNDARFINHSCEPNCEVFIFDDHVYLYALRDIVRNEELSFDYQLGPAVRPANGSSSRRALRGAKSAIDLSMYACLCGSPNCRGTMVAKAHQINPSSKHRRHARSIP